jgi:hypothetical protein
MFHTDAVDRSTVAAPIAAVAKGGGSWIHCLKKIRSMYGSLSNYVGRYVHDRAHEINHRWRCVDDFLLCRMRRGGGGRR